MKKFSVNKIYNNNCIDGMKIIPDEKIDLIITDRHVFNCAVGTKYWKAATSFNFYTDDLYYDTSGRPGYKMGSNLLIGYKDKSMISDNGTIIHMERPSYNYF